VPRVSILIPSYNHAAFLKVALESVQAQTFTDWEVVLLDDGSRDNSVEVATQFAESDPRINVGVNPQNLGTYGTQQWALDMANGEFVAVLNSDDFWHPTKLQLQVDRLDAQPDASACFVLGRTTDADGSPIQDVDIHGAWSRDASSREWPLLHFENRILASGVVFRRPLSFETTCRYSGDWIALLRAYRRGPLALVPEQLTYWRQHDNNTYRQSPAQAWEEIRVRESIRAQFPGPRDSMIQNEVNLWSLRLLFGDAKESLELAKRLQSYGMPLSRSIKRTLASLAPRISRQYVWRTSSGDWKKFDEFERKPFELINLQA